MNTQDRIDARNAKMSHLAQRMPVRNMQTTVVPGGGVAPAPKQAPRAFVRAVPQGPAPTPYVVPQDNAVAAAKGGRSEPVLVQHGAAYSAPLSPNGIAVQQQADHRQRVDQAVTAYQFLPVLAGLAGFGLVRLLTR